MYQTYMKFVGEKYFNIKPKRPTGLVPDVCRDAGDTANAHPLGPASSGMRKQYLVESLRKSSATRPFIAQMILKWAAAALWISAIICT